MTKYKLFTGSSNPTLSLKIAEYLNIPLGGALVSHYSDGEARIEIQEAVLHQDVFILQSTSNPANQHLIELLLMADAMRRGGATRITAVLPYFGYARQDKRKDGAIVPISAKVIADLLVSAGIQRVMTVDMHAEQIQGFFSIPVDNIHNATIFLEDVRQIPNSVIVSPDVGGVLRAHYFSKQLNHQEFAMIVKNRPNPNEVQVLNVIGHVQDCTCVIVDDIIDTGKTISAAAKALKEKGAKKVIAYATHPVLSGDALKTIQSSTLDELVVTDTIPLSSSASACPIIRVLSVSKILANAMSFIAAP